MTRRLILTLLFSASLLRGAEDSEKAAQSPDGRFTVKRVVDDEGGAAFQISERKSGRVVGRLPKDGSASFPDESKFLWAPGSKRIAWNRRDGGRYETTSIYQWKDGKFVELPDPELKIGYALIEREQQKQLKGLGLPKSTYQRRIWDTWAVSAWKDADTAEVVAHSTRSVVLPKSEDQADLDVWVRYTLKFDEQGRWKIAKTQLLTEDEVRKENQ